MHEIVHDLVEAELHTHETLQAQAEVRVQERQELKLHHHEEEHQLQDLVVWEALGRVKDGQVVFAPLLQALDALHNHFVLLHERADDLVLDLPGCALEVDQV